MGEPPKTYTSFRGFCLVANNLVFRWLKSLTFLVHSWFWGLMVHIWHEPFHGGKLFEPDLLKGTDWLLVPWKASMFISCSGRSGAYCILPGRWSYVYLYRYTLDCCFGGSELNLFFLIMLHVQISCSILVNTSPSLVNTVQCWGKDWRIHRLTSW